jgi:hypothetical protein
MVYAASLGITLYINFLFFLYSVSSYKGAEKKQDSRFAPGQFFLEAKLRGLVTKVELLRT